MNQIRESLNNQRLNKQLSLSVFAILSLIFINPKNFYNHYFYSKWMVVYVVTFGSMLVDLVYIKQTNLEKNILSNRFFFGNLLLIALGGVLSSAHLKFTDLITPFLDSVCGIYIIKVTYQIIREKEKMFFEKIHLALIVSTLIIICSVFWQIDYRYLNLSIGKEGDLSFIFFGNRNLLAEFLGVSFIVQFFFIFKNEVKKRLSIVWVLLLNMTGFLISLTLCRSIIAGVTVSLVLLIFYNFKKNSFYKNLILIASLLFLLSSYFLLRLNYDQTQPGANVTKVKTTSVNMRMARWSNSLCMLRDSAKGIGTQQFEFNYTKYHNCNSPDAESLNENIIKSPHNGYLELGIEYGWLSLFSAILLTLFIFNKGHFNRCKNFGYVYFVYFFIDSLFAFPLETGVMFYMSMIGFGFLLKDLNFKSIRIRFPIVLHTLMKLVLATVFFIGISLSIISHYFEYNDYFNYTKISYACDLFPANWRACIRKAQIESYYEDFNRSIKTTEDVLMSNQNNFVAIDQLARTYWEQKDLKSSCRYMKKFDDIFLNKSHLHSLYVDNCKEASF